MFFKLLLAFTLIPIIEIYVLITAGAMIGAPATIAVVLLTGIAGAALARSQGIQVIQDMQRAAGQGRMPNNELLEGLMILVGGITLLTPGFVTDFFGLMLLLPVTRKLFVLAIQNHIKKKINSGEWQIYITPPNFPK